MDVHRGVAQHTNGFYNVFSWMSVNLLINIYDYAGGMSVYAKYKYDGSKGGVFDLTKMPDKIEPFGISSIRHGVDYEKPRYLNDIQPNETGSHFHLMYMKKWYQVSAMNIPIL